MCPECGLPIEETIRTTQNLQPHPQAVVALVLGIVSIAACGFIGPVAIYFGHVVRRDIDAGKYLKSSRPMGTAGFICGIIATILAYGSLLLWIPLALV
jgi:hypothetical protein